MRASLSAFVSPIASANLLPAALYVAAFVLQIVGGIIIAVEVRDDRREGERIMRDELPVRWENVDAVGEAFATYLARGRRWRWGGVALIIVGAAVGLAANLLALS